MLTQLLAFIAVAATLTVSPGPDFAVVVRRSITGGRFHGIACGIGVVTGLGVWGVASAVGISAVLAASTVLYDGLRIAGSVYLGVLGVRAWRNRGGSPEVAADGSAPRSGSVAAAFRSGLVTNVLNPKVGVFYLSLLPAFLPPGIAVLPATLMLVAVHALLGMLWLTLIASMVDRARGWLTREKVRRAVDRVTGGVLVGFGLAAASEVALRA
ncbi:LysE family translocator [Pseudonocardia sp. Cha107L01]|jgi:threonine/homoserine/homoserine lactone efflux protein|uniref:LysE family translocator n=1 Tax=Pseudonocardia sp. Cha107L01 TaxID=3457576 RepID=UPI00403EE198